MYVLLDTGLAFDSWDLDYYTSMFQRIKRNPTSVECFDLAQSNRWVCLQRLAGCLCVACVLLGSVVSVPVSFYSPILSWHHGVPVNTVVTGSSGGGW